MLEDYRHFFHIQKHYLPKRSVHELNGYYYNVWKNLGCPVSEECAIMYASYNTYDSLSQYR
jgi:hypothetical protein